MRETLRPSAPAAPTRRFLLWGRGGRARPVIRAGFVLGIALLLYVSVQSYRNIRRLIDNGRSLSHTFQVRDEVNTTQALLSDAETAVREYLLVGNAPAAAVVAKNTREAARHAETLVKITQNDPVQRENADRLTELLAQRSDTLNGLVRLRQKRNAAFAPRENFDRLETTRPEWVKVRYLLVQMDKAAEQQQNRQQKGLESISGSTLYVVGVGGAFALLVVLSAFLIVERDLTRRNRVEDTLREREIEARRLLTELSESEARFRMMADTAPVMLYLTDPEGRATYLSKPWLDFRGRTEAEELGMGWAEGMVVDADRENAILSGKTARREQIPNRAEFRMRRWDGAIRWLLATSAPRFVDGQYVGHIGSTVDITEIKQAEDETRVLVSKLQASEERLKHITSRANCLLWEAQVDETTAWESESRSATSGSFDETRQTLLKWHLQVLDEHDAHRWLPVAWPPRLSFGEAFNNSRSPEDQQRVNHNSTNALRNGLPGYKQEFRCKLEDGTERWIQEDVHIEPFRPSGVAHTPTGDPLRRWQLVGVCTDITERKKQEDRLTALTDELRRSNEALDDFASIASHDLREPLRKIQMFGGILQRKAQDTLGEENKAHIERIMAAAGRMDDLVRDLLAFSRVTTKAAPFVPVNLDTILREVLTDLEARLMETGGNVELTQPLPSLCADPLQMRQLFQNLLVNALKFHKPDVPSLVQVESRRELQNGALCLILTFRDNGIGFEPEHAERIFNIFERLEGKHKGYEGTGVGLAICRKIVQRHNGTIVAQSQPGMGATFTVTLPM